MGILALPGVVLGWSDNKIRNGSDTKVTQSIHDRVIDEEEWEMGVGPVEDLLSYI